MADVFGTATIEHARKYWLERTPYTTVVGSLAAGATISIFAIAGWNTAGGSDMVATLYSLGITQFPNLQITITADGTTDRYFADEFPAALRQVKMGHAARSNMSVSLTNNGTTTLTNIQVTYIAQSWRAPSSYKILQGYALTTNERNQALAAGLALNPAHDQGLFPIPLDTVIERSYENRRVRPWLRFARSIALPSAGVVQTFDQIQARPGELLVLAGLGSIADFDDDVVLSVDRDNNAAHLQLNADQLNTEDLLEMVVPALSTLTFKFQAGVLPPANVPVRVEVLRVSMSLVLDLRMGEVTQGQVAQVLSASFQRRGLSASKAQQKAQETAASLTVDVASGVR